MTLLTHPWPKSGYILKQLLRAGQHENMLETAAFGCDEMWEELADLEPETREY